MGLDAFCNEKSIKVGSYDAVSKMQVDLLIGLKFHLEFESMLNDNEKEIMIDILVRMLNDKGDLYRQLNFEKYKKTFWRHDLEGFFPFVAIEDQGSMTCYEAGRFMKTFKMVKDSLSSSLARRRFVLEGLLNESIQSGKDISFF